MIIYPKCNYCYFCQVNAAGSPMCKRRLEWKDIGDAVEEWCGEWEGTFDVIPHEAQDFDDWMTWVNHRNQGIPRCVK